MVSDRAYLAGARLGPGLARLEAELSRITGVLLSTGGTRVDPAALQPAEVLLDLYGEDIRARAFVATDEGAEMMLRPDFTVPIARLHMAGGAPPARYVYCGPVWRRQEAGSDRPREYLQAGIEIFDGEDVAARDAEVLALIVEALGDAPAEIVTGDIGLVLAAIDALGTSDLRRAALRRHVWRPARFHALLERYGARHGVLAGQRADLLAAVAEGRVPEMIAAAGMLVGLRDMDEIAARVGRLAEEAETPPLDPGLVAGLEAVLGLKGSAGAVLADLRRIARGMPALDAAADRLALRLDAFSARGIDPDRLAFEASFGRTNLEYYDGFVFGAFASGRSDLPPVASGGRYDALTQVLGQGRRVPAVGGIVRPEVLLALAEDAA